MDRTLRSARQAVDRLHKTTAPLRELPKLQHGWIATIRSALGMTQKSFGTRLELPKQRMMADVVVKRLKAKLTWGAHSLAETGAARAAYTEALGAADNHDIKALLAFARS